MRFIHVYIVFPRDISVRPKHFFEIEYIVFESPLDFCELLTYDMLALILCESARASCEPGLSFYKLVLDEEC